MAIDRKLWDINFPKYGFPIWTCSKCNTGIFEIVNDTFHSVNNGTSEVSKNEDWFDIEMYSLRFCSVLRCNNNKCKESAILTGTGYVEEEYDHRSDHGSTYIEYFAPKYCSPPPAVFKIPEKTPDIIADEILQSFSIFFSQPNSAGNKIRTSIEILLDQQKVIKTTVTKKRKRVRISLHDRIIEYGKKKKELSDNILAIKWIGNSASHTQELEIDDIFDAYDLLHHVLTEIYDNRTKHIAKITQKRNKQKK